LEYIDFPDAQEKISVTEKKVKLGVESMLDKDQYSKTIRFCKENQKPLFFIDVSENFSDEILDPEEKARGAKGIKKVIEEALGIGLLYYAGQSGAGINRREFLKRSTALFAATYLMTPVAERIASGISSFAGNHPKPNELGGTGREPNEREASRKAWRILHEFDRVAHPETYDSSNTLDIRNVIMAQKSTRVAQVLSQEIGQRPSLNIYVGAEHVGIEKELISTQEKRIEKLHKIEVDMKKEQRIWRVDFKRDEDMHELMVISCIEDPAFAK
jgi:uncharacterized protein YpmB